MTCKVLDTCCFLSFFRDVTSCDMRSICHEYDMPIAFRSSYGSKIIVKKLFGKGPGKNSEE